MATVGRWSTWGHCREVVDLGPLLGGGQPGATVGRWSTWGHCREVVDLWLM